MLQNDVG